MENLKQLIALLLQKCVDFGLEHVGFIIFIAGLELAFTALVIWLLIEARVRNWFFDLFLFFFSVDTVMFLILLLVKILGVF